MLVGLSLPENKRAPHCPRAFCPRGSSAEDRGWCFAWSGDVEHRSCSDPKGFPPELHRWAGGGKIGQLPLPSHQHQLPQPNYAVAFRGGDAAHGPTATGATMRMLWRCLSATSLRPQAGKGEAGVGRGAACSPGGPRGRRSWPGRAAAATAVGAGQTAQPLPPGASLSSPRSWRLQNSPSLSAASLLPCAPSLPVPLQLRAPGPGRPEPARLTGADAHGGGRGHRGV